MPQTPHLLDQQIILSHYREPHNKGRLSTDDAVGVATNPVCGDRVRLQIQLTEGQIERAVFEGHGCSISQAAASILTDLLVGLTLPEAILLSDSFQALLGGVEPTDRSDLGELYAFRRLARHPVRIPCAYLAFDALDLALRKRTPRH